MVMADIAQPWMTRIKQISLVLVSWLVLGSAALADTAEVVAQGHYQPRYFAIWSIALVSALVALAQAFVFFKAMMRTDEGTPRMIEIAGHVRTGANAYLTQQYKVVIIFFLVVFALLAYMAFGLRVQSKWVPFAFVSGGFFSGLAGWFGMKTATWASSRTAAAAQRSLNQGLQVAFRSGAVMGLTVVGLALLDICFWFAVLYWGMGEGMNLSQVTVIMLCFGLGASSQALFARVGGGIFTKAADVGADLVGKVEQGIPEDDPRNPATIADNVGDNVGDVAGMGADLYESYYGSILATAALGAAAFAGSRLIPSSVLSEQDAQIQAIFLPMVIAGVGILFSIVGIYAVRTGEDASQRNLLKALGRGINLATVLVIIASTVICVWLMPKVEGTLFFGLIPGIAFSVIVGQLAGWVIGKWTEYSTSDEYKPTQDLAEQAETGAATIIIGGIADGMMSVWVPVITVCVAMIASFGFANHFQFNDVQYFSLGLYGVGIAAVGMLSTLGITLATDAYGPIADNAGGNAQMAELEPEVRERTDALDSLGNTTAATGKGFAIGSAALTALALMAAYIEQVREGFDRWGTAVVEQHVDAEYIKASPQFIVRNLKEKDEHGNPKHQDLLILDGHRHESWRSAPLDAELAGTISIDEEAGTISLDYVEGEKKPVMKYVERTEATLPDFMRYYDATLMNPRVLVGIFLGAMATFVFCAMTMKAVGRAAKGMVEEVRRQFKEKPGIMLGTEAPDYARPVAISTASAQKEMILPTALGLITPVATGMILGVGGVIGLLVGALTCGFCIAVFMANAGGAWDNAKKYVEGGAHGGKYLKNEKGEYINPDGEVVETAEEAKNPVHAATVIGDTVGDPFKDTSGPSLNILIKLMSMVSVVAAGLVVRYSLSAMGWF
jgi:K(+)-stimulated pyrophosphate-energized sodium pump